MAETTRILIVDDEPAVQQALSRALALERYDTTLAARRWSILVIPPSMRWSSMCRCPTSMA
jgi:DNA-binding NtrC family response regulator